MTGHKQTEGEYIVGIDFNPSSLPQVDQVKAAGAALLDLIAEVQPDLDGGNLGDGEFHRAFHQHRLLQMASEHAEIATMLAVKAVTKPLPKE